MPTQAYYRKWEKVYDLLDKSPYTSDSELRLRVQQEMTHKLTEDAIDFLHRWLSSGRMELKKCVECGIMFDPEYQGDPEDASCQECIDKRNADIS